MAASAPWTTSRTRPTLPDRLAGAIWGHLAGDAIGVPYEFRRPADIGEVRWGATGTHRQPPGTWSDDGALMLALLDSLLTAGFDTTDQAQRALDWYRRGAYTPDGKLFDIGGTTSQAIVAFERGTPAEDAGPTNEQAGGNGSLMRILPLALVERDVDAATLIEHAHRASRVTHGHERPQVACALYALIARDLLRDEGGRDPALERATRTLRDAYAERPTHAAALEHLLAYPDRGGRGRVWDSFWSAWDAFAGASSYADTIERAIRYGNDTDTTAAIAGGLAGIRWGIDGIPTEWLDGMRGHELVDPLVDRLVETTGWSTSTGNPLRVAWIDAPENKDDPSIGRFGITFLPGKRDAAGRRRHWRTVGTDMRALERAGASRMLLLVEDPELAELASGDVGRAYDQPGGSLVRYPIPDQGVPADHQDFAQRALGQIHQWMRLGYGAAIACRGGLGRSGLVAACMLVDWRRTPEEAIAMVRAARPGAIETAAQERFVHQHAELRRGGKPT